MSLKKNVVANYTSQLFIIAVSIFTLPLLLSKMGAEAYGLVGFFSLMQSWLTILDMGMSPTMSREVARYRGGVLSAGNLGNLFKRLRSIFFFLGIVFVVLVLVTAQYLSTHWLKIEILPLNEVYKGIAIIGIVVSLRWFSGFYKAVLTGFEQLVWLSTFNAAIAFLRFVVVFIILAIWGATPLVFFIYQLGVALIEMIVLHMAVNVKMPVIDLSNNELDKQYVSNALKFSLSIAFTSAVWVGITQTDKLILSKLMALSEFGYFTLAIQMAAGISLISAPITSAIIPRFALLQAKQDDEAFIKLYKFATKLIVIISGAISSVLVFFSEEVVFVWSGDLTLVPHVAPYLKLYAIGNFLISISAFPYYMQLAKGKLTYHIVGNIGFLVLLIPILVFVVKNYGGIGAGYTWISINILYLFAWIPVVHNAFYKNLNKSWILNDILLTSLPMIIGGFLLKWLLPFIDSRFLELLILGFVVLCIGGVSVFLSVDMRKIVLEKLVEIKERKK